jgi:hypothetical protein
VSHACQLGLEGIVSKRLGSPYRSGRSRHWVKSKNPAAPAVKREAEEDWGRGALAVTDSARGGQFDWSSLPSEDAFSSKYSVVIRRRSGRPPLNRGGGDPAFSGTYALRVVRA